jgi:putative hydrolase of the HAD superfamily
MKRKIQCIHFDLDSVLYIPTEFLETSLLVSVKAMIEAGLKATPSKALKKLEQIRALDPNAKNHFDRLCLHFNKRYDPLIIAAGVEKYWDCKVGIMTSAPEAKLVLSSLHDKYPLVIITNGPPLKQAGKIVRLGLGHFFSRYDRQKKVQEHLFYATAEKSKTKPHPHLWLKAQKDLGYDFSMAIMVGDRYWEDMFGAKRLGMITVKITQGPHAHETIQEAFKKASGTEEMAFFLKEHTRKDMLKLMKPDYTITSLRRLGDVLAEVERKSLPIRSKHKS